MSSFFFLGTMTSLEYRVIPAITPCGSSFFPDVPMFSVMHATDPSTTEASYILSDLCGRLTLLPGLLFDMHTCKHSQN